MVVEPVHKKMGGGGLKSLEGLYRREGCVHVMEVEVAHYFCITGGSRPAKSLPPPLSRLPTVFGARRRRRLLMFVSVLNGGIYIGARSPPGGNRGREEIYWLKEEGMSFDRSRKIIPTFNSLQSMCVVVTFKRLASIFIK